MTNNIKKVIIALSVTAFSNACKNNQQVSNIQGIAPGITTPMTWQVSSQIPSPLMISKILPDCPKKKNGVEVAADATCEAQPARLLCAYVANNQISRDGNAMQMPEVIIIGIHDNHQNSDSCPSFTAPTPRELILKVDNLDSGTKSLNFEDSVIGEVTIETSGSIKRIAKLEICNEGRFGHVCELRKEYDQARYPLQILKKK